MKIILEVRGEHALVIWTGNNMPFVTVYLEGSGQKVGDQIASWHHGHYFTDLQQALDDLKSRSEV